MEQNAMAIGNIVWWIITVVILAASAIIGFFIKRYITQSDTTMRGIVAKFDETIDKFDKTIKELSDTIKKLTESSIRQESQNVNFNKDIDELWETSDTHTADIEDVKKRVNDLETIHNYCKNNHNKRKSDEQS